MAIQKGTNIKSMFTNENVLGVKEHNSLLQEKEEVLTPVEIKKKMILIILNLREI